MLAGATSPAVSGGHRFVTTREQSAVSRNSGELSARKNHSQLPVALWISVLIASATVLRIFELGKRSLWLDEAASSMLARTDWHTFVTALLRYPANMALYYLLLRGWIHLGHTEA
jgi:hypothetical protein